MPPSNGPQIVPKLNLPRVVGGDALVATPAEHVDANRPHDFAGREIRAGYRVSWNDQEFVVAGYHRYVRDGEDRWRWMLVVGDPPVWAIPLGQAGVPVRVIEPSGDAPQAQTTDTLLHRLRELVAAAQTIQMPDQRPEWVALFDELDYRMGRPGYPIPTQWRDR